MNLQLRTPLVHHFFFFFFWGDWGDGGGLTCGSLLYDRNNVMVVNLIINNLLCNQCSWLYHFCFLEKSADFEKWPFPASSGWEGLKWKKNKIERPCIESTARSKSTAWPGLIQPLLWMCTYVLCNVISAKLAVLPAMSENLTLWFSGKLEVINVKLWMVIVLYTPLSLSMDRLPGLCIQHYFWLQIHHFHCPWTYCLDYTYSTIF